MRHPADPPPRRLTLVQKRKVLAWWIDRCLRIPRKRDERYETDDVWTALQLSLLLLKRDVDALSQGWAAPAIRNLKFISQALYALEFYPKARADFSEESKANMEALAERLDWAVAMIKRELDLIEAQRAYLTRNHDLLLDALGDKTGCGSEAVEMIRHIQETLPEVDRFPDGDLDSENTVATFVWDTYLRVALLDQLANEFPRHIAPVARQMHAWPMLRHRHTSGDARFEEIAARFELGADYPLDTRRTARFRPDSPMVRYLDGLVPRLSFTRYYCRLHNTTEDSVLIHCWRMDQTREERQRELSKAALDALRQLKDLPSLVKSTAAVWSKKAVIPWMLATDANGPGPYTEKAIEQVRLQRDIKSRAIFQSRLESKVSKTLRSLVKPG